MTCVLYLLDQTEAAADAGVLAVVMVRTEEESSASPPATRIYSQEGDDFKVSPLPVLGATYSLGSLLLDYADLSDTVNEFSGREWALYARYSLPSCRVLCNYH